MLCGQFCHFRGNQIPTFPPGVSVGPHTQKLSESCLAEPQFFANDFQLLGIALIEGANLTDHAVYYIISIYRHGPILFSGRSQEVE